MKTIEKIMNIIHTERVELEIFELLSEWMIKDRNKWIDRAMDDEAIIRAINKIATQNKNKSESLQGIISLSEVD